MDYFYVDIETVPLDKEKYLSLDEEERKKLLNPIDSRIVAIGVKKNTLVESILQGEDEASLLREFWSLLERKTGPNALPYRIVGFNIKDFDLPFLVTRSFILNVPIVPFLLKDVIDIREQISAYKYGPTRGKLKEFAALLNIPTLNEMDGSQVAERYWNQEHEKIREYLRKDLEITQKMHERMKKLRIDEIGRW
ncbi:MAG: hypothetical protein FJY86_04560 [Candidatus Diapherotrites archaeon]|uniref:Predicted 3'-5' exonuclease PolB-like domain-containing protein n=1 Tax=Candidatus Iainarchaeum sp. TaxID=3101447 RepID=A0A8T4C7Z4_9ARCH|nr:hypothetical protein [Candidatus Diapherotrites archaeon]